MDKIEVDFHMHSFYSDGTYFPEEILELAKKKGLKHFSITDHDSVSCNIDDPMFIQGIEISVKDNILGYPIKGLEVLGYGFDIEKMREKIEPIRKEKMNALLKCIENFNKFDFESNLFSLKEKTKITLKDFFEFRCKRKLTNEEVKDLTGKSAPSKMDLAEFLLENFFSFHPILEKVYGNLPFLFKKEFSHSIFNSSGKKLSFKQAIDIIKQCGGIAVLAHPGICSSFSRKWFSAEDKKLNPLDFLKILKEYGLDGVEIYNYNGVMKFSKESMDEINKYFSHLSKELGLLNTYGSDCHGEKWWGLQLGNFGSSAEKVEDFLSKLR